MPSNAHVKEAMETLLKMFEEGNLEKVARAVFKGNETPSDNWSFLNRLLMYLNNTEDARGFRQWQQTGRRINKGSKAFYILAPMFKKVEENGEEFQQLIGFRGVPVFRVEDTEGAPLKEQFKPNIPYEFNGIIQELGLQVDTVAFKGSSFGSYNLEKKEIKLASPEIEVFLHELAHAVDHKLNGLKPGQRNDQEVTAEFSAAVIGFLMGYQLPFGNMQEYIKAYNFQELFKCMARIEKIISFVVERTGA